MAAALYSFFVLPFSLCAQSLPVFRTDTDVVVVPVTVTDRSGRFVPGLTAADFEISDDGDRRAVAQFSTERVPVSLGILLDISGSMATDPKARAAGRCAVGRYASRARAARPAPQSARRGLLRRVRRQGGAGGSVDARSPAGAARVRCASPRRLHGDVRRGEVDCAGIPARANTRARCCSSSPMAATAWCRASAALRLPCRVHNAGGAGAGGDLQRQQALRDAAVGAAQRAVKTIGRGAVCHRDGDGERARTSIWRTCETLTADSGGYVEAINDPSEITAAVARIFDELQSQYMLAFEPAHADGKHHDISVTTKNRDLRVRARAGYTAAESKKK